MDDIAEQLAIRDRFRKKMALLKTPSQRMRELAERLNKLAPNRGMSPAGYAHFMRRNFKKRAIDHRGFNGA